MDKVWAGIDAGKGFHWAHVLDASISGVRAYDGAKKLSGRKRHLLVDTLGMVLKAKVHAADLQDRAAVPLALEGAGEGFLAWGVSPKSTELAARASQRQQPRRFGRRTRDSQQTL